MWLVHYIEEGTSENHKFYFRLETLTYQVWPANQGLSFVAKVSISTWKILMQTFFIWLNWLSTWQLEMQLIHMLILKSLLQNATSPEVLKVLIVCEKEQVISTCESGFNFGPPSPLNIFFFLIQRNKPLKIPINMAIAIAHTFIFYCLSSNWFNPFVLHVFFIWHNNVNHACFNENHINEYGLYWEDLILFSRCL
jgi:hypothetical protein